MRREMVCGRCRKALGKPSSEQRVAFDNASFDLCPECWHALNDWIGASARIRESGEGRN
jgi:hypothetical protein